jgi:thioredoxin-like negative regulator of GroEL
MKKEIEEILRQSIWDMNNANDDFLIGYNDVPSFKEIQDTAADKIISLIEKEIGECEDEIRKYLYEIFTINLPKTIDLTQDIINIIKSKIKE